MWLISIRTKKLEVLIYPTGFDHEATKMEVHYHLGKANIIADALSHKPHCNYLPAVRLTGEEYSTRVLANLSLFNITLTPTLRDEIIAAQKDDEGMGHIK
jgi:hypothetical protein